MKWPERPTCHDADPSQFARPEFMVWRDPDPNHSSRCECGYQSVGPYGYPFKTCGYDGSISAEDLARALQSGARLSGSDWKYGWPHKFYVEGVPNPLAGNLVDSTSTSGSFEQEPTAEDIEQMKSRLSNLSVVEARVLQPGWAPGTRGNAYWLVHIHGRSPAPQNSHAKFYTVHLEDDGYDKEAHDLILRLVSERSGITFCRKDGEVPGKNSVSYSAPYFGYQRA